ncbi:MAG: thiamine pyrophosphate-dependent dehydrogenase E1 component subunit alpha [Desulfobacterales bacterium]|nr:MAG: thiamine pyrophosphate-dependent dehydrogenase E1 component subunit alpha [Desulfobacterales bacterium]
MKKYGKEQLVDFYTKMLRIRRVEETLVDVFSKGEIPGFIHVCIGQEAAPAAVCSHLTDSDYMATTHRGHGHALAKGIDLKLFMAELFGKKNGVCRGRSGSMHVADRNLGILGANGIVGGGIPLALGAAFASRYKKTDQVTACFFGDGAVDEGTFHESLNLASLLKLPIVFVCENNGWSQFTSQSVHTPVQDVSKRAAAYGIPGIDVSNDFIKIYEEAGKAISSARSAEGPSLLEVKCKRWQGHFVGDQQKYRPEDDIKAALKNDCITSFREMLLKTKVLAKSALEKIDAEIQSEIDDAVNFARESDLPSDSELMENLYV